MELTVFDFFDNDAFVEVNKNKKFTDEEKVAIIVRSVKTSLNQKFKILENIKSTCNKKLYDEIEEWISCKKRQLEILKKLKADGNIVCYTRLDDFISHYSSLQKAYEKGWRHSSYCVYFALNDTNGFFARALINKSYSHKDEIDFLDDINNIIVNKDNPYIEFDKKLDIYKYYVELDTPFKPFDYVYIPGFNELTSYFVVADEKDPDVKATMSKENKDNNEKISKLGYWLKLNTPNYFLETNTYGGHNVKAGEVTQSFIHQWEYSNLCGIKIFKPDELNDSVKDYIREIKRQLSNKVTKCI